LSYASTILYLLQTTINSSIKERTHLCQGSERAIRRYDRAATRSHCKNNNASIPTRRVTSRRCQAIVLKSYTLQSLHRASTIEKKPAHRCICWIAHRAIAGRVTIGAGEEYQDKEKRQSVLQQAFHIPTFALLFRILSLDQTTRHSNTRHTVPILRQFYPVLSRQLSCLWNRLGEERRTIRGDR